MAYTVRNKRINATRNPRNTDDDGNEPDEGCTCRMESVYSTMIDPPEVKVDRHCPIHGRERDPDDARDQRNDDRMMREWEDGK